ncbi:AAA family ATPase [Aggregatilinea lenta]|uniref:AAA family ATPase n=1 Tax=Aggregatilinea lenta TaxID=913108 RepID=UPI0013C2CB1A|nr:ATP-binding protein [Aggregatilinea lenta]
MSEQNTYLPLESIDDGDFETLVTYFLRTINPALAELISTGINASGKPIPCPVDNIYFRQGNPPQCIAIASTTTKRKNLKGKWLGPDGDIYKSKREFENNWADTPNTEYHLYLATNLPIKSDIKLYRDAVALAQKLGIIFHLVEASQLVGFLDTNPDGQYLRWSFFGIPVERLGPETLKYIAARSLLHHETSESVVNAENIEIERDIERELSFERPSIEGTNVLLQGASGAGKSTLARHIGHRLNESGGVAIWLPAEKLYPSATLSSALLGAFQEFLPSLQTFSANEILNLPKLISQHITLIVDDINRLSQPNKALKKLSDWTNYQRKANAVQTPFSQDYGYRFVVPVWPELARSEHLGNNWKIIELRSYSSQERERFAAAYTERNLLPRNFRELTEMLGGDPFLCGLATNKSGVFMQSPHTSLIRDIFEGFLRSTSHDVSENTSCTPQEALLALDCLVALTIEKDAPLLPWDVVRNSCEQKTSDILFTWSQHKSLGWITITSVSESWRWKHQRLRDMLIGRFLARQIEATPIENLSDILQTWLENPGLAEAGAISFIFLSDEGKKQQILALIKSKAPLVLAEILRLGIAIEKSDLRSKLIAFLRDTLSELEYGANISPLQRAIWEKLVLTNDTAVLDISGGLEDRADILAARLRNGDILAGLRWIDREKSWEFLPSVNYPFWEQSVEAFARLADQNRTQVIEKITRLLRKQAHSDVVFLFAGYLAWKECASPLAEIWETFTIETKLSTLTSFIWMMSRCGSTSTQKHLAEALSLVQLLEDRIEDRDDDGDSSPQRYYIFNYPLEFTFQRWEIDPSAAKTWAHAVAAYPEAEDDLCFVARVIDYPETVGAHIRWCARNSRGFLMDWAWPLDPNAKRDKYRTRIAERPETRAYLWRLFEHESDENTRYWLLMHLERMLHPSDLDALRAIPDSDALYEMALKMRLRLYDETGIEDMFKFIEEKPLLWFIYLSLFLERNDVYRFFVEHFERALKTAEIAYHVIRYLPPNRISGFIGENLTLLRQTPRTWNPLWRTEHVAALQFVQDALAKEEINSVKRFFHGITGYPYPVSLTMLDALVPVLDRFTAPELTELAVLALRNGHEEWARANLMQTILANKNRTSWSTKEDLKQALDLLLSKIPEGSKAIYETHEFYKLARKRKADDSDRLDFGDNAVDAIREWLGEKPSDNQVIVASMLLVEIESEQSLQWWETIIPTSREARDAWSRARFSLRRAKWQSGI